MQALLVALFLIAIPKSTGFDINQRCIATPRLIWTGQALAGIVRPGQALTAVFAIFWAAVRPIEFVSLRGGQDELHAGQERRLTRSTYSRPNDR